MSLHPAAEHPAPFGQRLWEKTWWAFALLFLGANAWAWSHFGAWALLRFWAAFFALLGACILVYARRARRQAEESTTWLPVRAKVLRSEVVREEQRSFGGETYDPARTMVYYHPEIEYEYEVGGRQYRSSRLIAVRVNFPRSEAEAWVARYPAGAVVTARYNPGKPQLSVLQPGLEGFQSRYRIPFIAGGVFLILGAAGWLILSWLK